MTDQREVRARRTQADRRHEAERALLDAAAELFAEQGVTQTSLAQIGERAGYSRGLANHHFGSKDALVDRLARRAQERFFHAMAEVDAATGRDGIVRMVEAYLSHFEEPTAEGRSLLVMWGATFPGRSSVAGFVEADQRARDAVAAWVVRGQEDGSVSSEVEPAGFAVALLGLVRGVAAQQLAEPAAIDTHRLRAQCRRLVERGLGPGAGRP